jgi:tRNA-splicing ligase RtcB
MAKQAFTGPLEQVGPCRWRIPRTYKPDMRVDGVIYADEQLIAQIRRDQAPEQVANVATLPGIQQHSLAMPDIHWGYGFAIGGVAATDPGEGGVVSPGGVGYDINCGVRVVRSNLVRADVRDHTRRLIDELFHAIPSGVGRTGKYRFEPDDMQHLLTEGPRYLVRTRGLGTERDIEFTEAGGRLDGADPAFVSHRAFARGEEQCGTLGSGNHFLEVQVVDRVLDEPAATAMALFEGQIIVLIHSGSRGLGYQVCDDFLARLRHAPERYGIELPDRQLACAPVDSAEGQQYLAAMRAAANFAWCNRQLLMQQTREVFQRVFGRPWEALDMHLVYDVAHNIAKFEDHRVNGRLKTVCVHRKGATRAFPPGHPEIPQAYRTVGQPVLIPGSMGTASWILVGQSGSMEQTFGTTCHGAGRQMSRTAARKKIQGAELRRQLEEQGIVVRCPSNRGLAEEAPFAYKAVEKVVAVVERAGLAARVAELRPLGVVKG